jgi:hypothetical protein
MELIKNQKWVCAKFFDVEELEFGDPIGQYNIGDIITIDGYIDREWYDSFAYSKGAYDYDEYKSKAYFITIKPFLRNIKLNELIEYFIPLAEWRQQQIDKILDDGTD